MSRTFLIAEAGVNHCGRLDLAFALVDAAARAGADAVKFQTFVPEAVAADSSLLAPYQGDKGSQLDLIRPLALSFDDFARLDHRCRTQGILFLSTAFDEPSADFLNGLGMPLFKIASGEITHVPLLRKIASFGKPLLLSTGMATLAEVEAALRTLSVPRERVTLLHCNSAYPTPPADANLRAMVTLGQATGCRVGFSDHTEGIEVSLAAAALGAAVIEKHFTLDRALEGPDHAMSLTPGELSSWAFGIRKVEAALGDGEKRVTPSEEPNRDRVRRRLVARRPIESGEVLSSENVTAKRAEATLGAESWDDVIGRAAPRAFLADEPIVL